MSKCASVACLFRRRVLTRQPHCTLRVYMHTGKDKPLALIPSTKAIGEEKGKVQRKRRPRWTEEQEQKLDQLLMPYLLETTKGRIDWKPILSKFEGVSLGSLRARYAAKKTRILNQTDSEDGAVKPNRHERWSAEEDDALRTAMAMYGGKSWDLVSRYVGTRTQFQCIIRWRYMGMPMQGTKLPAQVWRAEMLRKKKLGDLTTSKVTPENMSRMSVIDEILSKEFQDSDRAAIVTEDDGTLSAVEEVDAAELFVHGRIIGEPFTEEEDNMICRLVRLYGKKWVKITQILNVAKKRKHDKQVQAVGSEGEAEGASSTFRMRMDMEVYLRHKHLVRSVNDAAKVERVRANKSNSSRLWTTEEDQELAKLVEEQSMRSEGFVSWSDISSKMSNRDRTAIQCNIRWTQYIGLHLKRSPYTAEEDRKLWPLAVGYYSSLVGNGAAAGQEDEQLGAWIGNNIRIAFADSSMKIGLGWVSAGLTPGRSRLNLLSRITRLQRVMTWLHVVGNIQDPCMYFELVCGLANTPEDFRIVARYGDKNSNKDIAPT
ncbi:hypothetical protein EV175_002282 [Coemansia sp. RSA 1933]|nr:hypothetical protein EV175_002282 [Coemansia sp. RSA 1933]